MRYQYRERDDEDKRSPFSLLLAGAGMRLLGALVLVALLWLAVWWAVQP